MSFSDKNPACTAYASSGNLAGEMLRYIIERDDPRLRFPVGPDALPFLGWRTSVSDEDWIGLGALERDADYFERVFLDTGVDLLAVMSGSHGHHSGMTF